MHEIDKKNEERKRKRERKRLRGRERAMVGMPDEREINSKDRKRVGERDRANHSQRTQRVNEKQNGERKCVVITNDMAYEERKSVMNIKLGQGY